MESQTARIPVEADPAFASILCGVNGSRPSQEAGLQAALLTDPGAALTYVAVSWERGSGTSAVATITHAHARKYLRVARHLAHQLGVDAATVDEHGYDAARRMIALAADHDLLVLGITGHSRAGGIVIGNVATAALHRSPIPVLVARRPPAGVQFPARIVLASDGTPICDAAAATTARIAARHHSQVTIVAVRDGAAPFQPGLAEHAALIAAATGTAPEIVDLEAGPPHRGVTSAARDLGASLIVMGSRGLTGLPALRSVSERVAHAADSSVLVVR
jgi:nucleotide-binding universal stress UspA family protein